MNKEVLENLINKGLSSYQIAKELNKSQTSIRYWLHKFNLKTNHRTIGDKNFNSQKYLRIYSNGAFRGRYNDSFWKMVNDFYQKGHTLNECCKQFKCSIATIVKASKLGKIQIRSPKEAVSVFLSKETPYARNKRIQKIKNGMLNSDKVGGYREGAGRSKKFKVRDSFGQTVCLQSSYEFDLFNILNTLNVKWLRPVFLSYNLNGRNRKYFADFYLPDSNLYLDTKNDYLFKIDAPKIEAVRTQNQIKLIVITKNEISLEYIQKLTVT